jgi:UDP-N-acetylglucosamine 2-epimerase
MVALQQRVAQKRVPRVHFLGYRRDVPQILRETDIATLVSKHEGLPKYVMEAMAAGKPVVASNVRGNRDLVADGRTGLLVEPGDVPGLAKALETLISDRQLRVALGAAGREKVQDYFLEKVLVEMTDIYDPFLADLYKPIGRNYSKQKIIYSNIINMKKILVVFGTRPEAIKLAPIVLELRKYPDVQVKVCVTAQHRQMLDQVLGLFEIVPDIDLDLMRLNQTLSELTAKVVVEMDEVIKQERPDVVLVQGDTTTVMAAALSAFYNKIQVGHVEAGLRSDDLYSPFPEEMNRRVTTILSSYHFAPTERARNALLKEGVSEKQIFVTGNSVIDALYMILKKPVPQTAKDILNRAGIYENGNDRKMILVTAHRRENFGERFESICHGIKQLTERNQDVVIVYPVHLNPNVQEPVTRILKRVERILLVEPVEYDTMVHMMNAAKVILTDSGGIQEEAPSLGKPVLVMRTETERPEGIEAGTAKLVGPYAERIVNETERLLRDPSAYNEMAVAVNPYGDGKAAQRIVKILKAV